MANNKSGVCQLLDKTIEYHLAQRWIDEHLVALGIGPAPQIADIDSTAVEITFAFVRSSTGAVDQAVAFGTLAF